MSKLQRVVIRDELIEDAKRIAKRYALRSWGDAINFVFAAHRDEYLRGSLPHRQEPNYVAFVPGVEAPSHDAVVDSSSQHQSASLVMSAVSYESEKASLREFLAEADYSMS